MVAKNAWSSDDNMGGVAPQGGGKTQDEPKVFEAERSCRDVFFLLLFVAYWVGMAYVASQGVDKVRVVRGSARGAPRRACRPAATTQPPGGP